MRLIGIYKIINLINQKIYIGQFTDIKTRWYEHRWKATHPSNAYASAFSRAFRKYGEDNFEFEIIELCSVDELDEKERYYIKQYNCLIPFGYNLLQGGQDFKAQVPHCSNCNIPISKQSSSGLCKSCYQKQNLLRKVKNRPEPLDLAKLVLEKGFLQTGKDFGVSDNTIKKWCKAYSIPHLKPELKKWYNKEMGILEKQKVPLEKKVAQIDPKTEEIVQIFQSTRAAARALNKISNSHITEVCNGKGKTAYGYKWSYI